MVDNKTIQSLRKMFNIVLWLEMISVIQRLVFDFLGYMWLIILLGIATIVFIVFGMFGAYQHKTRLLLTYMVWAIIWIILNFIIIMMYANTGSLTHKNDWLSLGQGNTSWFYKHGAGCKEVRGLNNDITVQNCLMKFEHVEIIQASVQILIAIVAFGIAFRLRKLLIEAKDFYVVGNLNPQASYVKSNNGAAAAVRTSKPFVVSSYP